MVRQSDKRRDMPGSAAPVRFSRVLICVCSLTVLSLAVAVVLASQDSLSEYQQDLLKTCSTTWKLGFGAIIGLIGGKAT